MPIILESKQKPIDLNDFMADCKFKLYYLFIFSSFFGSSAVK